MKTADLTGHALDWAVAKCEGAGSALVATHSRGVVLLLSDATADCEIGEAYAPSTNWAQGGPVIEREGIRLHRGIGGYWWAATDEEPQRPVSAPTPLVAAMRCYVASKLGDEAEIPAELEE